ncbi:WD repeat-containing protein 76-like [Plakobranchus ocellatus]|uniref:WD repeat-containing protein 76 n=1 Tax=Plakobranchus ocellatus TaxID=259542 RepID=A0AAV4AG69_9GAST|nr:WD repeat-containing protein 76-like [Plakobranchus ocellatus]
MRRSLITLGTNKKPNGDVSADEVKQEKLTHVKSENMESEQMTTERKPPQTHTIALRPRISRRVKKELTQSPKKTNTSLTPSFRPEQKVNTTPVKVKKEEVGSSQDASLQESPKVDENKDPAMVRISPRKRNSESPIKSPKKMKNHLQKDAKSNLDDSESNISDDEPESFNYAEMREKNLRENELFFASLGIDQAKEALQLSVTKPKKPTQKGLKVKKEPVEILPRRKSLRIKRIDPEGNQLPEPEPVVSVVEETRLPAGPAQMEDCLFSKHAPDPDKYLSSFKSQMSSLKGEIVGHVSEVSKFSSGLSRMSIVDGGVAKVVPDRVFSVTWHPAISPLIAIAGDKWGKVGLWNVMSQDEEQMVTAFKPHTRPVSCLMVPPDAQHKLYSSSYDATLRCGDFEKGIFNEVFSVPEQNDDLFRNFCFYDESRTMLVSHFSGNVSLIDVRTSNTSAEQVFKVSQKSLRTVSVHPTQRHYFITAGTDTNICLWDIRKMSQKSPKPLQVLSRHSRAIASAYFSPLGHKIVSSAADDTILVFNVPSPFSGADIELWRTIKHNNCTGRWLTNFQPTWHPTVPYVFVVGSMARPREIQVFDASLGKVLHTLTNEDHLGSVCSLNVFHPQKPCTLVGANSSGRLHVFQDKW